MKVGDIIVLSNHMSSAGTWDVRVLAEGVPSPMDPEGYGVRSVVVTAEVIKVQRVMAKAQYFEDIGV